MKEEEANKKLYRVVQIEGKITWKVEELWDGGVERAPFGNKEAAIKSEERIARENGFINDLVLEEVVGKGKSPLDSFERDSRGAWHCIEACTLEMENAELVFNEGMTFTKGTPFMMVDVAKWLDEHS